MIAPSQSLADILRSYLATHWLAPKTAQQYEVAVTIFHRWHGSTVPLDAMTPELVMRFLRDFSANRSPKTCNDKRQVLLTLCRHAGKPITVPKLREIRRVPTAWSMDDLHKLLLACDRARLWTYASRSVWLPAHWRALILTCYDTGLRIGCLLDAPRSCVDLSRQTLLVPGELQKQRADTLHRLHRQTCETIGSLPPSNLLFPWPMRREQIWVWLGRILEDAGLPTSRRDKFHKLRRTSYSHVYRELGLTAASRHAGHSGDMSAHYLDPTILDQPDAVDVMPRP